MERNDLLRAADLEIQVRREIRKGNMVRANRLRAERREAMTRFLTDNATRDADGVWRWDSNNSCPPDDYMADTNVTVADKLATKKAYAVDTARVFAEYRARQPREATAEERAEMRAAFGEGVAIVDVISGRRTVT